MENTKFNIPIILASQSPRRKNLLKDLEFPFYIRVKNVEENFDSNLSPVEIVESIVNKKSAAFLEESEENIIICADTLVFKENKIFGKPKAIKEAYEFLNSLSNGKHQVMTGVKIQYKDYQVFFYETTDVYFRELLPEEIDHYIQKHQPFDKAGSYGIQDWIGHIGIEKIEGSYTNVMGLPTHALYRELKKIMAHFSQ